MDVGLLDWNLSDSLNSVLVEGWGVDSKTVNLGSWFLDIDFLFGFDWTSDNNTTGGDPLTSLKGNVLKGISNLEDGSRVCWLTIFVEDFSDGSSLSVQKFDQTGLELYWHVWGEG